MNEAMKYLNSLGIAPILIIIIGLAIWVAKTYITHKLQKERKLWEEELKFLSERHIARSRLLEELNGLIHEFDHYINHVFEGDGGWYEEAIEEKYKEIRSIARKKIELVSDFPDFEENIYKFTSNGRTILESGFDFTSYNDSKDKLNSFIVKIRETLPRMKS